MGSGFVHLRVHSEYSIVDGLVKVEDLVDRAVALGMPAVALTDRCNLFALIKFYDACLERGREAAVGAELTYCDTTADADPPVGIAASCSRWTRPATATCSRSVSKAYLDAGAPRLSRARRGSKHTRRRHPSVGRHARRGRAGAVARRFGGGANDTRRELEPAFSAIASTSRSSAPAATDEDVYLVDAVALAAELDWPVVATNDVCFLARDDFEAHETRVCIQEGRTLNDPRRIRRYSEEQYLKSAAEMEALFADLPEALENSVEIAKRCNVKIHARHVLPAEVSGRRRRRARRRCLRRWRKSGLEQRFAA